MKFEVGQTVRVKKCVGVNCHMDEEGCDGKVGKIVEIRSNGDIKTSADTYHTYFNRNELELVIGGSMCDIQNAKYGVSYLKDEDPTEFFKTKKEAQKRIEELLDESEVDKSSVYLFELGKVWEVKRPVNYELVEV